MSIHLVVDAPVPPADDEASEEIAELLAPIVAAERELLRLKERATERLCTAEAVLRQGVLALGLSETEPARRAALAGRLYWHHPNVGVGDLVSAFGYGSSQRLLAAIGPVPTGYDCEGCAAPMLAANRRQLKEARAAGPGSVRRCPACLAAERRAEEERYRWEWEQERRRWEPVEAEPGWSAGPVGSADQDGMPAG